MKAKVAAEARVVASAGTNLDPEDDDNRPPAGKDADYAQRDDDDDVDDDDDIADDEPPPTADQKYAAEMPEMIDSGPTPVADVWKDDYDDGEMTFADELGIEDVGDILFTDRGKIFSAAGRESPIAEFGEDGMLLRPPQKPYQEDAPSEEIIYHSDEFGILLNELGERRKIVGARYRGNPVYVISETKPGTVKHYAAWFDKQMQPHKFFVQGDALTSDMVFRIRNRTHDGEISIFPEIQTE